MTNEEIISDAKKFTDYLAENGAQITSGVLAFEGHEMPIFIGATEELQRLLLICIADRLGYELKEKP